MYIQASIMHSSIFNYRQEVIRIVSVFIIALVNTAVFIKQKIKKSVIPEILKNINKKYTIG